MVGLPLLHQPLGHQEFVRAGVLLGLGGAGDQQVAFLAELVEFVFEFNAVDKGASMIVVRQPSSFEFRSLTTSANRNEWLTHHLVFLLHVATFATRELREVRAVNRRLVRGDILDSVVSGQ